MSGCTTWWARAAPRSSTSPEGPRSERASSRRCRSCRSSRARSAGRRSGWRSTSPGRTVSTSPAGEVGELVCRKPWPSMTRGVWGDPQRYLDSYWSRWPDVWAHGDWASVDEDGCWYLHGRLDDTLNVAGKRIGPAEFESAAVLAQRGRGGVRDRRPRRDQGRGRVGLLRAPAGDRGDRRPAGRRPGARSALSSARRSRPPRCGSSTRSRRPRTAKIVRLAVRAAALGEDPGDLSSLENPGALEGLASPR